MPPIDDAGRHEWLEGFCQAHADYSMDGDFEGGESVEEALDWQAQKYPQLAPYVEGLKKLLKSGIRFRNVIYLNIAYSC
jgi:hypothetical protein